MRPEPGSSKNAPRAVNRWYACDITAGREHTIGKVFDEADRRDPGHARTWIALVDGDIYQLGLIQDQAAPASPTRTGTTGSPTRGSCRSSCAASSTSK